MDKLGRDGLRLLNPLPNLGRVCKKGCPLDAIWEVVKAFFKACLCVAILPPLVCAIFVLAGRCQKRCSKKAPLQVDKFESDSNSVNNVLSKTGSGRAGLLKQHLSSYAKDKKSDFIGKTTVQITVHKPLNQDLNSQYASLIVIHTCDGKTVNVDYTDHGYGRGTFSYKEKEIVIEEGAEGDVGAFVRKAIEISGVDFKREIIFEDKSAEFELSQQKSRKKLYEKSLETDAGCAGLFSLALGKYVVSKPIFSGNITVLITQEGISSDKYEGLGVNTELHNSQSLFVIQTYDGKQVEVNYAKYQSDGGKFSYKGKEIVIEKDKVENVKDFVRKVFEEAKIDFKKEIILEEEVEEIKVPQEQKEKAETFLKVLQDNVVVEHCGKMEGHSFTGGANVIIQKDTEQYTKGFEYYRLVTKDYTDTVVQYHPKSCKFDVVQSDLTIKELPIKENQEIEEFVERALGLKGIDLKEEIAIQKKK